MGAWLKEAFEEENVVFVAGVIFIKYRIVNDYLFLLQFEVSNLLIVLMRDAQLLSPRRELLHHVLDHYSVIFDFFWACGWLDYAVFHHYLHRFYAIPEHDFLSLLDFLPFYILYVLDRP